MCNKQTNIDRKDASGKYVLSYNNFWHVYGLV